MNRDARNRDAMNRDAMDDVDGRFGRLASALRGRDGLVAAYLYGSFGTSRQTPLSDLDLALVFAREGAPDFDQELALRSEILAILGEDDVSITLLHRSDPIFQYEVLSTGRLILCTDEAALADFTAEVLHRHADFAIDHESMLRDYDAGLRAELGTRRDAS